MPSRPRLLQDLSKQVVANEVPGVKGGFTEPPKRLVGQSGLEGMNHLFTPESGDVCVAYGRGGVKVINRLPGRNKQGLGDLITAIQSARANQALQGPFQEGSNIHHPSEPLQDVVQESSGHSDLLGI